ncbi:MAG: sulfite exporter TauE/SafE family protein [Cyclobacteriaceae bacterium]|nr:sulfite exporter TauE/SafE family protein [Cyclobacteriaceae bacterium]
MLWSAFLIGLFGSFHCIGMCGPIALALPIQKDNKLNLIVGRVLYNIGRAITYATIGLFFGLVGQSLSLAGFQQSVSIIAGVLILLMVLLPSKISQKLYLLKPAYGFTNFLKRKFGVLLKQKSVASTFFIGLLNGFLPCGLVYIAVAGAIATGGYLDGAIYMFVFGIGTLPIMLTVSLAGNFISLNVRKRINKMIPAFMIVLAFLFILRGMNLGIPYVSPQLQQSEITDESVICH